MTQNAENAIRNGIKYLQPCLSTLLTSPCSSNLMILVNILSDVPAFLQHIQTHSNVFYFPVSWNRQFNLPGNFLFSAFWEPLHCNLPPLPLVYPPGLQSLLRFTAFRELLCPPIILAALGDEGDGSPDIPWQLSLSWPLRTGCLSLPLEKYCPQSQNPQRCSALISQRGSTCFRTHLSCWSRWVRRRAALTIPGADLDPGLQNLCSFCLMLWACHSQPVPKSQEQGVLCLPNHHCACAVILQSLRGKRRL